MLEEIYEVKGFQKLSKFFIGSGIIILAAFISLGLFTLSYWLITLILPAFFNVMFPFSWNYAFGGWLIWLVVTGALIPRGALYFHKE